MKCSLAPVCLPEEARLASMLSELPPETREVKQLILLPADDDRRTLHVLTHGARIGRKGDRLEIGVRIPMMPKGVEHLRAQLLSRRQGGRSLDPYSLLHPRQLTQVADSRPKRSHFSVGNRRVRRSVPPLVPR